MKLARGRPQPQPRPLSVRRRHRSPKGAHPTQFSTHACYGKTAKWIKMPHGTEVGLGPRRHCVRWRPSSPPQKRGTAAPTYWPMCYGQMAGRITTTLLILAFCKFFTHIHSMQSKRQSHTDHALLSSNKFQVIPCDKCRDTIMTVATAVR